MPVKLFTGLPGAGKTACLVDEIVKLREREPERPIFQRGINGLAEGLAGELTDEQLHHWWELPPGAIICIDECQETGLMPMDKGQPAEWVKRISKVRHEGMDFLLTTQHPNNMSAYVRRLVDYHVHAVRKFNTQIVSRYMWGRCMETPEKPSSQKGATVTVGTLPKAVFDLYKSASMHTMKKRIPKKVYFFVVCALVAVVAIVSIPFALKHLRSSSGDAIAKAAPAGSAMSSGSVDTALREKDYAAWLKPRVEGLPWTAPAYDGQSVVSHPQVFCIAVEDGRCSCVSEQGTRIEMKAGQCRMIAANGVYNPFHDAVQSSGQQERRSDPTASGEAKPPTRLDATEPLPPESVGRYRAGIGGDYIPPQLVPPNA